MTSQLRIKPLINSFLLSLNTSSLQSFWRCYKFAIPHWKLIVGGYFSGLVINGLVLLIPQFIRWVIDNGIYSQNRSVLSWSVMGLLGITVIKGVLTFFQGRFTEVAAQNVAYELRNKIQEKITILSFSFHDHSESGQLLSRAIQDVDRIRFLTGRATLRIIDGVFLFIGTAFFLFQMNTQLALLVICVMPLLAHRAFYIGSHLRPLSLKIQNQLAVLTTILEQNLRGARIVKSFSQEDEEIKKFEKQNELWFSLSNQGARIQAIHTPLMDLIINFSLVMIIWVGGIYVTQGVLSLGELVAFTTYLGQLFNPIRMLGQIIPAISMAIASGQRIFDILDTTPEVRDLPGAKIIESIDGLVQFEHVDFSYQETKQILRDISFTAYPGEIVALLGATGSGKSTIINLIPRFYDPTAGKITLDNMDIRSIQLRSLRSQIGIVLQETQLFAGTIRENIAFGKPEASDEEILQAARSASVDDFIDQLPKGLDTHVGEKGVTLSGGQKQRIALARAILMNPKILILDDAMSSVDTETEQKIQLALDRLMEGRTSFVIAHRLSTIRRANKIIVVEKGKIVAEGDHSSLYGKNNLYTNIYNKQLRSQDIKST